MLRLSWLSINQSVNARFVGCHNTTRPGAPAVVSYKYDKKVHIARPSALFRWMYTDQWLAIENNSFENVVSHFCAEFRVVTDREVTKLKS